MAWANFVGMAAATLTTVAFFPQAYKTLRSRDTTGLSLTMYLMLITGVSLWLLYGLIIWSWPLIIANAIVLVPQAAIVTLLIRRQLTE